MFINYHYSKTLIFRNRPYKEKKVESQAKLKVELNFEKKMKFKCYPFPFLQLIYPTFHFNYFREGGEFST